MVLLLWCVLPGARVALRGGFKGWRAAIGQPGAPRQRSQSEFTPLFPRLVSAKKRASGM
jgi:hypothetical protein